MRINTDQTMGLNAVSATVTQTGASRNVSRQTFIGVQMDVSGAAALGGTLKLQGRIGTLAFNDIVDAAGVAVAITFTGVTGTGSYNISYSNITCDDIRCVWTPSGGTGTMTVQYRTKEVA